MYVYMCVFVYAFVGVRVCLCMRAYASVHVWVCVCVCGACDVCGMQVCQLAGHGWPTRVLHPGMLTKGRDPWTSRVSFRTACWGDPIFGTPAFGTSAVATPAFGTPGFGAPAFGTSAFGTPAFGAPGFRAPAFGTPAFRTPGFGALAFRTSAFGTHSTHHKTHYTLHKTHYTHTHYLLGHSGKQGGHHAHIPLKLRRKRRVDLLLSAPFIVAPPHANENIALFFSFSAPYFPPPSQKRTRTLHGLFCYLPIRILTGPVSIIWAKKWSPGPTS